MTGAWLGRTLNCFYCLGDWFFESNSATIRIEFDRTGAESVLTIDLSVGANRFPLTAGRVGA
jgi:hypothetical protein